jgi:hypothetical protein
LEIYAWTSAWNEVLPFETPSALWTRLRKVKLYGHVPKSFAKFICQSAASTMVSLETCILDEPVASNQHIEEEELLPISDEDAFSDESDLEELNHEMVAPRPLAFSIDTMSFSTLS